MSSRPATNGSLSCCTPSWNAAGAVLAIVGGVLLGAGCPPGTPEEDGGGRATDGGSALRDGGTAPPDPGPFVDGGMCANDDDPLTQVGWAGFCDDRVDDNCTVEDQTDPCPFSVSVHNHCNTGDEPCPATQPGSGPPQWDCQGQVPRGVLAWGSLEAGPDAGSMTNPHVAELCVYVYESGLVDGEHYLAVRFQPGEDPAGPDAACAVDFIWRHYLFLSNLDGAPDTGDCEPVTVDFPSAADAYKISNGCRKAMRPLEMDDPLYDPDIQFFAFTEEEARAKLAVLESAEVGCLRAIDSDGVEVRPWVTQAVVELQVKPAL